MMKLSLIAEKCSDGAARRPFSCLTYISSATLPLPIGAARHLKFGKSEHYAFFEGALVCPLLPIKNNTFISRM